MLALFCAKFACNSTFRNPVFSWESCKGSVWESVKKNSRVCTQERPHDWHAGELKSHTSCCTTRQNFQSGQVVSSQLKLATQSSREAKSPDHSIWEKLTFRIPNTDQYKYPLYPHNVKSYWREFWERNLREKQNWLIHNLYTLIFQIPLLSPFPLIHPWEVH